MENQVKSITRELNLFPEFMGRAKNEVWRELHKANIADAPCVEHGTEPEDIIILRPDKTSVVYREIRSRRISNICPVCGWEICHR